MREQYALMGSEDELIALYEQAPAVVDRLMASVPCSTLTQRVTGIQPVQPDHEIDDDRSLAAAASAMARETGRTYEDCWRTLRAKTQMTRREK